MRKLLPLLIFISFLSTQAFSQTQYEVLKDSATGTKLYKGIISRDLLSNDTAFGWWKDNFKAFTGKPEVLSQMTAAKNIELIVYMGTWCEDSHFLVPRLFNFLDAAKFPRDKVTVIAVDRTKRTVGHLAEAMNITNVPTVIVMRNGKEVGRVIEYGHDGVVEPELVDVIAGKGKD